MMPAPYLSVVVPLLNEEDNVDLLNQAIAESLKEYDRDYEVIFVDDGSDDQTFTKCQQIARKDQRVKIIRFRRNFGQTPAMAAGIDYSTGDVIVTMDGDLQNDPRDILTLVKEVEGSCDLAVGWRFNRQDKLISRKIPSKIANWLIGKVTGVPIKDNGCSLKAYRADMIRSVPLYSEMHRFIPAMASLAGARVSQIKVRHHARQFGQSKYGLSRVYKVLFDLLTIKTIIAFSSRPLHWFAMLAVPFLLLAILATIWAVGLAGGAVASSIVARGIALICGGGGVFFVVCGILTELVYKTGDIRPENFITNRHGADAGQDRIHFR